MHLGRTGPRDAGSHAILFAAKHNPYIRSSFNSDAPEPCAHTRIETGAAPPSPSPRRSSSGLSHSPPALAEAQIQSRHRKPNPANTPTPKPSSSIPRACSCIKTGKSTTPSPNTAQALERLPNFPEALDNLALALESKGGDDEAIADLQKSSASARAMPSRIPISASPIFIKANTMMPPRPTRRRSICAPISRKPITASVPRLMNTGKTTDAIAAYRRALELRPNYVDAMNNLGVALQHDHQTDAAIDLYQKALALHPKAKDIQTNFASALREAGRNDEARAAYERAVQADPGRRHRLASARAVAIRTGTLRRCDSQLREDSADQSQSSRTPISALATAYYQLGRYPEAAASYEKELALKPNDPDALYGLAMPTSAKTNSTKPSRTIRGRWPPSRIIPTLF